MQLHPAAESQLIISRGETEACRRCRSRFEASLSFPLTYHDANAYDFSRDLSTIVYARPGRHADLDLLSKNKLCLAKMSSDLKISGLRKMLVTLLPR